MSLPTDLHREIADLAEPPGFDVVLARAGRARRRRRTTIASGLAAAVVVGGLGAVAGGAVGTDDRSSEPSSPAPSTSWDGSSAPDQRLSSDVRAVLDDDQLQLWSITGGAGGAEAALWRGCDVDPCRFALVIRDDDDVFGEALGTSFATVTTVPDGWLVEDGRRAFRLTPSGDRAEIFDTGPGSGDVMAGDTAVPTSEGWRLLRGDKLIPIPVPPSGARVTGAYVTPGGRLVTAGTTGAGVTVSTTDDGRTWDREMVPRVTAPVSSATVAGSDDRVVVALLGDDRDGSVPVVDVLLSRDAGGSWSTAVNLDTEGGDRVRDMSSLAVTPDGTAYLTTGSHHLLRIDDEGFAVPVQLSAFDTGVFASADQVCLVSERGRYDALLCSSDGITGWGDQPLPGLG